MPAGRPRKAVDEKILYALASLNMTRTDICHILDIDEKTLRANFSHVFEAGRVEMRRSILSKAFEVATKHGNMQMLKFLLVNCCGMSEKVTVDASATSEEEIFKRRLAEMTPQQLAELAKTQVAELEAKTSITANASDTDQPN